MSEQSEDDTAVNAAETAIVNAGDKLQARLERKASRQGLNGSPKGHMGYIGGDDNHSVLYETLLHEFLSDCVGPWHTIEDYGSEIYFARSLRLYINATLFWNKHIFACIRSSRGEISRQRTSNGLERITTVVYECDSGPNVGPYLQDFDCFERVIHMFITSPLRTAESMGYVLEYYETLVEEVRSSIAQLEANYRLHHSDRELCEKRLEHLEIMVKQLECGFDAEEFWWGSKRPLSAAAQLRRQDEEIRAKRVLEDATQIAEQRKARERELNEARLQNENLRLKFRNAGRQSNFPPDNEGVESTQTPLVPFAISYEDENFTSTVPTSATVPNFRPWPRNSGF